MAVTLSQVSAVLDQVGLGIAALQAMIAQLQAQGSGASQAEVDALYAKAQALLVQTGTSTPVPPTTGGANG